MHVYRAYGDVAEDGIDAVSTMDAKRGGIPRKPLFVKYVFVAGWIQGESGILGV